MIDLDPEKFPFCSEFYVVDKVIDVVVNIGGESQQIRIEALRAKSGHYSTRAYVQDHVKLQSAYGGGVRDTSIWVAYDLPWTSGLTPDAVLTRALSFLSERCSK